MSKKIAIIDDDPNICRFLSEALKHKGYGVEAFPSAEAGLEPLGAGDFQLALVNILLPGMSGLELCRTLRSTPATAALPVVLMSASPKDARLVREAREEYGATDYLLKPFTLASFHERIQALIGAPEDQAPPRKLCVEGDLAATALPTLLHNLYTLQATGLLHLERGDQRKVVYFKEGYPIFVRSNLVRECLGQMLVKEGLISPDQCEESLRKVRESGRLQGTILIEMGLFSPQQLRDLLSRQVTAKLLAAFAWSDGNFRFIQARNFKAGVTSIEMPPAMLILQGIRRYFSDARVATMLAPHRRRYLAQTENPHFRFQELALGRQDTEILVRCRGDYTLEELLARYPLSRHEVEQLLAALLTAGILESREQPVSPSGGEELPLHTSAVDKEEIRQTILADYARLLPLDHFALLGVTRDADPENIRRNYFALAKKYHPDQFLQNHLSQDLSAKLNELFQRLGEAYQVICDPQSRRDYLETLAGRGKEKQRDVTDILQAEAAFQKGVALLRARNYPDALEAFGWAVKLNPREAEYLTQFAWAKFKTYPGDRERAAEVLQTLKFSLDLNQKLDRTHLYLGYLLKEEGRAREAERRFELAIKCNPNCTEALRELRLINMRRSRQEGGGLFGKFFKK